MAVVSRVPHELWGQKREVGEQTPVCVPGPGTQHPESASPGPPSSALQPTLELAHWGMKEAEPEPIL